MEKPILEITSLTKTFGEKGKIFTAVSDVSFAVGKGETVGFLGRNGAGKTTTINMILTLITPTSGTINIFGKELHKSREEILGKVNIAASYLYVPWRLTVWEFLYMYALLYSVPTPKKKVDQLVEQFNLSAIANKKGVMLSSGERSRAVLAKAFVNSPELVLLDEPTASLDPDVAVQIRKLLMDLQKRYGTTMLITSHNMAEVEEICERVIVINHGKIIAQDTPVGLARSIKRARIKMMMIDGMKRTELLCKEMKYPFSKKNRFIEITIQESAVSSFLAQLAQKNIEYDEISIDKPTLEDYFLSIEE
jgi:ABC-2 type transport system ATP-binding protein